MAGVFVTAASAIAMGADCQVGGFWVGVIFIGHYCIIMHARSATQTFRLRIENDEFGSNFGRSFALEKWHQTAQVLQVKRVANAGAGVLLFVVPDHCAMQPAAGRWTGDIVAQRLRIRDGTLLWFDLECLYQYSVSRKRLPSVFRKRYRCLPVPESFERTNDRSDF